MTMFSIALMRTITPTTEDFVELQEVTILEEMNKGLIIHAYYSYSQETHPPPNIPQRYDNIDIIIAVSEDSDSPTLEGEYIKSHLDTQSTGVESNEDARRIFRGILTNIKIEYDGNLRNIYLTIESVIRLLKNYNQYYTYIAKKPSNIIKELLEGVVKDAIEYHDLIQEDTYALPYLIQAGDNSWNFLQFLLGDRGIRITVEPSQTWGIERVKVIDGMSSVYAASQNNSEPNTQAVQEEHTLQKVEAFTLVQK